MKRLTIGDLVVGAYIFVVTRALLGMLLNGPSDFRNFVEDRSPLLNVAFFSVHLIFIFLALFSINQLNKIKINFLPVIALIFWCAASVSWSDNPYRTIIFSSFIAMQALVAASICATMTYERFFSILKFTSTVILTLSLIFIFLMPSYGRMTLVFPGFWQGIFTHKNVLGQFCAIACIVYLVSYAEKRRATDLILTITTFFVLYQTHSSTALLAVLASMVVLFFFTMRRIHALLILVMTVGLGAIAVIDFDTTWKTALTVLGKSETLTGRTTVWTLAFDAISTHPILGFGFGAFWTSYEAERLRGLADWYVPHAHNGFLEVLLQIGVSGLVLFFIVLYSALRNSLVAVRNTKLANRLFPVLFLVVFLVLGLAEITYLNINYLFQLILFMVSGYNFSQAEVVKLEIKEYEKTAGPSRRDPIAIA